MKALRDGPSENALCYFGAGAPPGGAGAVAPGAVPAGAAPWLRAAASLNAAAIFAAISGVMGFPAVPKFDLYWFSSTWAAFWLQPDTAKIARKAQTNTVIIDNFNLGLP